jgi:hypothetical protein
MIIKNTQKIKKQNSLRSELIIKTVVWGLIIGLAIGLIYASGTSFSVVAGVYLGYKILRLVMRLFGLVTALVFTVVRIFIPITIILIILIF